MIKGLDIRNFQSHKNSIFNFHPGVNIIIGTTDSGKSAIVRSIKWLKDNRPAGDAFRSKWGGRTEVFIETDTAYISREKSDKDNLYVLNNEDLEGFGTDVPEEVAKALNLNDINIQDQHVSHFLISSTPGEVASFFNKIAQLDQIGSSISYVNKEINNLKTAKKSDEKTFEQATEELKQYEYLDKFEIDLEVLERDISLHTQAQASYKKLQAQLELLDENTNKIKASETKTKLEKPVDSILKLYKEKKELEKNKEDLHAKLWAIVMNKRTSASLEKKTKLLPLVTSILYMVEEHDKMVDGVDDLKKILQDHENATLKQLKVEEKMKKKEAKLHKYMPSICPLCGK